MDFRLRETLRYLGYGKHAVDEQTYLLISESFEELEAVIRERFVYRIFDLVQADEELLMLEHFSVRSKLLVKNMKGCQKAVLFAATLGVETDLLVQKTMVRDVAKAAVMQACAATRMEELCDRIEFEISDRIGADAYKLKPRFSPGYGDLSLEYQRAILDILEAQKKIGITLTDSYMLSPTKSVTAFIGIMRQKRSEELTC